MKQTLEEAKREYIEKYVSRNEYASFGKAFIAGAEWERQKAIETYRNLCPSYKIKVRYECGNHSHRQEWKTTKCDMNCQYMKNLMERL